MFNNSKLNHINIKCSLDDSQKEIIQLPLLVDIQKEMSIVQGYATPHQIAAGNLFIFLMEGQATVTSPQF